MKKIFHFLFLGFALFLLSVPLVRGVPLTDLAEEQFERGPSVLSPTPRSPFIQTYRTGEEIDVSGLLVQGTIYGKDLKMALLSGRILREGETIGRYKVEKIEPDGAELSFESNRYHLKLENYVPPIGKDGKKSGKGYKIEFRNAALPDALKILAKGDNRNVIIPEDIGGLVTVSFQEVALAEALRSILRVNGYEYAVEAGIIRIGRPDAFAGGTDLRTESYRLKYATAKDLVEKVRPLLSDRGAVIADERTNILMVKDRDPLVANIGSLISQVDRKDRQVQIEARIVDASRSFSREIGIRWGISGQTENVKGFGTADVGTSTDSGNPLNVNLGATNPTSGVGFIIGSLANMVNIEGQLTAAEQKGDVHILSKPSVTTLNNMPAKIRSGTKIFVKSTSSISVGTPGGVPGQAAFGGLQEIDTGITLTVTPQISIEDFIKLKIEAVQSEADFSRTVDGIPAVIDNTAMTTVLLKDGETTVIGGLYRQKTSKTKRGIPGLQNIPVMGLLFQSRARTKEDGELMIFITPKIVEN